jgi:hypothetical protein
MPLEAVTAGEQEDVAERPAEVPGREIPVTTPSRRRAPASPRA